MIHYATIASRISDIEKQQLSDPRDIGGLPPGTMATPSSLLNFDFVSDKPQNEIFTFGQSSISTVVYRLRYIE